MRLVLALLKEVRNPQMSLGAKYKMEAAGTKKIKARCRAVAGVLWALGIVLLGGCNLFSGSGDYVKEISAAQPDVATAAMSKASETKSQRAIEPLVKRLYDEDPVIRLSAITALRDITGEDMGYRYYEPEVKRVAAIKRWEGWVKEQELVADQQESLDENSSD